MPAAVLISKSHISLLIKHFHENTNKGPQVQLQAPLIFFGEVGVKLALIALFLVCVYLFILYLFLFFVCHTEFSCQRQSPHKAADCEFHVA